MLNSSEGVRRYKVIFYKDFLRAMEEKRILSVRDDVKEIQLKVENGVVFYCESDIWISEEMIY